MIDHGHACNGQPCTCGAKCNLAVTEPRSIRHIVYCRECRERWPWIAEHNEVAVMEQDLKRS